MAREKFEFTWPGKKAAIALAKQKTKKRLHPCREESCQWDTTANLYIEGDNIDGLKLLQKEYAEQVDMIFIDPPYNTGSGSFVYADNYDPRFHAGWCSMMYPRLMLAQKLLREDGVIFISLDDGENAHMRLMMNEIFGEENFIAEFIWEKKKKPSFLHRNVARLFDYILCYGKKASASKPFSVEKTTLGKKYPLNNAGNGLRLLTFPPGSVTFGFKSAVIEPQDMSAGNIRTRLIEPLVVEDYTNQTSLLLEGEWRYSQQKVDEIISAGEQISIHKIPFRPNHIRAGGERKAMKNVLSTVHYECETNEDASAQIMALFGQNVFETPKPVGLVKLLIQAVTYDSPDAVILDFFSGSASTAHAVMALNAEDGGRRRFIMIQIPEVCNPKSAAHKAGYENICQIGRDRIKRAGDIIGGIGNVTKARSMDTGFRAYRIE